MDTAFRMISSSMASAMLQMCMQRAAGDYNHIAGEFPLKAQDVLPLAYRMRVLFT
jgi:hypothetical protein